MRYIFLISLVGLSMMLNVQAQTGESFYRQMQASESGLSPRVWALAYQGWQSLDSARKDYLVIIDYSLPSVTPRFFIINCNTQEIEHQLLVAHGKNTGNNVARHFSNTPGSKQSSLGFFLTGQTYYGKHGYSLNLHGLEPGINDKAYARRIVIHGAWYVTEEFAASQGRLGRSWGCPAVAISESKELINLIKNGVCLFIYGAGYKE